MKAKLTKWGNSYAVRIPKKVIDDLQLTESDLVLEAKENGLLLTKDPKKTQLARLLKGMKPQEELDWGAPRGKEAW